jgi:hypothetical protein
VGTDVTVPAPLPAVVTVRFQVTRSKVAVQALAASMVTAPSEQSASPVHPVKVEPAVGVAVRVTVVLSE